MKLSAVFVLSALFLGCVPAQADSEKYDGMYFVTVDTDNVIYMAEGTTIATPAAGFRVATIYRIEEDGIGNIQSWEFRCKDLGTELLSDHDYEHFADGTWGDADGPPKETDFTPNTMKIAMGQVADFACRWPRPTKHTAKYPPMPADPKTRIQFLIAAREKPNP